MTESATKGDTLTIEIPRSIVHDADTFAELLKDEHTRLPDDPVERSELLASLASQLEFTDDTIGNATAAAVVSEVTRQGQTPSGDSFEDAIDRVAEVAARVVKGSSFKVSATTDGSILDIQSKTVLETVDPGKTRGGTINIGWGPQQNLSSVNLGGAVDGSSRH